MANEADQIRALAEEARLAAGLRKACLTQTRHNTVVGVLSAADPFQRAVLRWSAGDVHPSDAAHRFLIGCVTKAWTAVLVAQAVAEGAFGLDDAVVELLGNGRSWRALAGVTVRHLLNHTHGLDASTLAYAPRTRDDFIDPDALYRCVAEAGPLAAPGDLYSYGQVGSWWAAAILEQHLRMPYTDILRTRLLEPLEIRPEFLSTFPPVCCPARGGGLRINAEDLLQFLLWQIGAASSGPPVCKGIPGEAVVALPGIGLERGAGLGWLYYGEGWFGHTALVPNGSICVRFHSGHKLAFVVATDSPSATLVAARLFAKNLPEFRAIPMPRPYTHWHPEPAELETLAGTYRNGSAMAVLAPQNPLTLELALHNPTGTAQPARISRLRPCPDQVFLLDPVIPGFGAWVQLIGRRQHGYDYLWNGKELLPRRAPLQSTTYPFS
jgi:CubicO group peptidase (beta-lactamase class C family)